MPFRALLVDMHYSRAQKATWKPWTSENNQYHGWEITPDDGRGPTTFIYTVPNLDAPHPEVHLYTGLYGDPERDTHIGRLHGHSDRQEKQ